MKRRQRLATLKMVGVGLAGGVLLAAAWLNAPAVSASVAVWWVKPSFGLCRMASRNCVIDGDTFKLDGEKIRIADIDTPEKNGRCEWESMKAREARDRLIVLLNAGPFDVLPVGDRDEDRYGRKLRIVVRGGASLGDQLVSEGLARTWTGRREPWC